MRGRVASAAVALVLIPALAMPAFGAVRSGDAVGTRLGLPVRLTSTSTPTPWFNSGVVAGRLGGVPVVGSFMGTSTIGLITLTVHQRVFAYGTYACLKRACSFVGMLAGATRAVAGVFPNRRAWVTAVADWARRYLSPTQQGSIVAEAASIPES